MLEADVGVNAPLSVEIAASNLAVWKDLIYQLDDSLIKVNADGVGRVLKQLLQLEEGMVVGVRFHIWQKHLGTWVDYVHRTSAITKHSI